LGLRRGGGTNGRGKVMVGGGGGDPVGGWGPVPYVGRTGCALGLAEKARMRVWGNQKINARTDQKKQDAKNKKTQHYST